LENDHVPTEGRSWDVIILTTLTILSRKKSVWQSQEGKSTGSVQIRNPQSAIRNSPPPPLFLLCILRFAASIL